MTTPQHKGGGKGNPAQPKPGAGASKKPDEPAKYQPTKHDAADKRVYGRMKGDENDPRLRCPKDSTYMEKVMVGRIEIDRCAGCGAMWFDGMELERILAGYDAKSLKKIDIGSTGRVSGGRPLGNIVCPRDRSDLIPVLDPKQTHIEEMACTMCGGILLDAGELVDLSEFTLGEKLRAMLGRLKKA